MNNHALIEGEKVAKESIIHLTFLGIIKLAAGLFTGMTVMMADALSTFADILGVFASYFGLRLSRKSADKNFEYGYYKIETFAAFVVSLGIIYAGYVILMNGIAVLGTSEVGHHRPFAITATVIAIVHSYRLNKKLQAAAEKTNSLSLLANARDKKADMFAGFVVLVSIIANYQGIPYVEGAVTITIALLVFKVGLSSSKESLFFLLDYWDDPVLTRKIRKVFSKEKDLVQKVSKLRLRRAGTFIFGEAFIEINPYVGIQDLREELNILKAKIEALNPYIKDFAIYTHISKDDKTKVAIPVKNDNGLESDVASNLKETHFYLFAEIEKGKVKKHYLKKVLPEDKKPVELSELLVEEGVNIVINNKLNSLIYFNLRRTHHILVYPNFADICKAGQTIKLLTLDT